MLVFTKHSAAHSPQTPLGARLKSAAHHCLNLVHARAGPCMLDTILQHNTSRPPSKRLHAPSATVPQWCADAA